jgi:hypothetical protein
MPEIETLFVRIEADLSAFKRGLREAGRETRAFANEANRAFADVGTALDLSPFRKELAQSERAASQAAERMSKAFAKVGKAQHQAALKALEKFGGAAGALVLVSPQGVIETPAGSTDAPEDEGRIVRTITGAIQGAPLLIPLLLLPGINVTLLSILALMTAGAGIGAAAANADALFGGDSQKSRTLDEVIKRLDEIIAQEKQSKENLQNVTGLEPKRSLEEIQKSIDALTAQRDALLEQQRQAQEAAAARTQEFLRTFTELSDCLRQLCARIDELAPAPSGAAGEGGVRPDGVGFDPHASMGGGQVIPASFDPAASPLGGGAGPSGLDRELADTGWQVDDLTAGFMDLTQAAGGFEAQGGALVAFLTQSNALLGEQSGLLGQLSAQAPVLGGELATMFEEGSEAGRVFAEVADAVGASLLDAFEGAIARGESLSDVLKGLALDMAEIALKAAGNALLSSILGGLFGGGGGLGPQFTGTGAVGLASSGSFAKGAAFAPGSVMARNIKAFARGGIVDTPEAFAFAHGLGIMGEAGPEAILPLARMAAKRGANTMPPPAPAPPPAMAA